MEKSKRSKPTPKPATKPASAKASAGKPENTDLTKVSLYVNEFGEIIRDVKTDDINAFLDKNVPDKKFLEGDEIIK